MKAQISMEMLLWMLISISFLSVSAGFSYHALHSQSWSGQNALYINSIQAANLSIQPYSEFGIVIANGT